MQSFPAAVPEISALTAVCTHPYTEDKPQGAGGDPSKSSCVVRPRWNMSSFLPSSGDQYAAEPLDNE